MALSLAACRLSASLMPIDGCTAIVGGAGVFTWSIKRRTGSFRTADSKPAPTAAVRSLAHLNIIIHEKSQNGHQLTQMATR